MKKCFFILYLVPFLSFAQELTTTVSKNPVAVGEQFQISFSANGDIEQFRAPSFNGLRILSGPNKSSSSSIQIINGQSLQSKKVNYDYNATALNEGSLEIGSASAKVDGRDVKSNPIKLNVGKANPKSDNNVLDLSDKVYIKAHINKTKLFQGEQLVVSYKLYSKITLENIDITTFPELNGFWKEEVETSSRPTVKTIDGVNHNVWEISRIIVTPLRSGILEIDPMKATITVQVKNNSKGNNPFGSSSFGFFDSYKNIDKQLQSANRKIEVLPLPNPPADFSGAVGEFYLDASLDKKEVKINEIINYRLTLSGSGNLPLIDEIPIEIPDNFDTYGQKLIDKSFNSKNIFSGKRVFEELLIARHDGNYTIPGVDFVYFNTKSKNYEKLQTNSFEIKVRFNSSNIGKFKNEEKKENQSSHQKTDIILAIDISGSMLAKDFSPDRLEASKKVAMDFISERPNDRIGLVIFSAESFTQCPLTNDHKLLLKLFKDVKSGILEDGTAIGMGLATAVSRLKDSKAKNKLVILLTDGVNNKGSISPMTAAEIAQQFEVRVYTIGVGTLGHATYPFKTPYGTTEYQEIEVKIDEQTLQDIASATNGKYFRATSSESLKEIYQEIDQMERSKIETIDFSMKQNELKLQISRQEAEKILEIILRQEKELQEDLQKKKSKGTKLKTEKDW